MATDWTDLDTLDRIIRAHPPTVLRPHAFFIAWSGVPTLAYRGFSPTLLSVKRHVEASLPWLAAERPGSRWPKTTLGALRDGRTLAWEEAIRLREVCDAMDAAIRAPDAALEVRDLTVVRSGCKSLERRHEATTIPLAGTAVPQPAALQSHEPPAAHCSAVDAVLRQFDRRNLRAYWHVHLRGGNRESHYRCDCDERTLVFDLTWQPDVLDAFIRRVDAALPDAYRWFDATSRHVTLRTLTR
jgi:hypothetical protein